MKRIFSGASKLAQTYFQYPEMEEKFHEILSCPICMEIPEGAMFQCKNGHLICPGCKQSLEVCPQCREVFGDTVIRCRAVEEMLDAVVSVPCDYKNTGCFQIMKRKELAAHRKICQYRPVKLCSVLGFPNCLEAITTGEELRKHLETIHNGTKRRVIHSESSRARWPKLLTNYMNVSHQWVFIWRHTHGGDPMFMTHAKISIDPLSKEALFSAVIIYLGDVPENYRRYLGTLKLTMFCQKQQKCVCSRTGPPLHFKAAEKISGVPYFTTPIDYFKNQVSDDHKDFDLVLEFSVKLQLD